ncbi:hypothetical protein F441_01463 [Phytophthora nicotianae CJ01A1]|uniref:Uncharacterized protein n=1 Tax=Phytophthora nicotianae CJ01A1 TaxID=1317063 RepID=W2XSM9_PHYNI|nr:hypothetical protein F441_01463 [Phytophthora nicotianae CJ01A1]
MSRIQEEVVQDVFLLVRELTSGLRRRYKTAYLYGIWKKALLENNTTLAAAIYSYLSAEFPPEATRRVPLNSNALSNNHCIERFRFDKLQIEFEPESGLLLLVLRESVSSSTSLQFRYAGSI